MMRRAGSAFAGAALAVAAVTGCSAQAAPARHPGPPASYYLALGDSLAQGVQPDAKGTSVPTGQGYANVLYAALHRRDSGLRLVKLGCLGETTATMIHGGVCRYAGGSQLNTAVGFLRAHHGHVALITLDIGANDPEACLNASIGQIASCASRFVPQARSDLRTILTRLRQADPGARVIAMNYYLPALAEWRHGLAGELIARVGELATSGYNDVLTGIYRSYGVAVANVFGAFHTADFSPQVSVPGLGLLPRNVATICQWTWECAGSPRGPNQHPNQAGYQAIAQAFLAADPARPAGGHPA
jgi:lysophospholipase L1-like esterase